MHEQKQKILIVEDSVENIDILSELLTAYKNIVALNGEKGLEILESGNVPDLVLLDIEMPGIDGYEVCKRIRSNEEYNNLPIIFLTGRSDTADKIKGFESGGQDFVTKPFDKNELLARVKTQLELKSSRDKLQDINIWLEGEVAKRTEQLEEANTELKTLDKAKSEFLTLVSHETRTPLNGISALLEILKDMVDSEEILEVIDIIADSAKRIETFSSKAITITSIISKKFEVANSKLNLSELTRELVGEMEIDFTDQEIEVSYEEFDEEIALNSDTNLIKTALSEIILNALMYNKQNGSIRISLGNINKVVRLTVINSGEGFSELAIKNQYKPFGYGQEHVDQKVGLGLYLAKLVFDILDTKIEIGNTGEGEAKVEINFPAK